MNYNLLAKNLSVELLVLFRLCRYLFDNSRLWAERFFSEPKYKKISENFLFLSKMENPDMGLFTDN